MRLTPVALAVMLVAVLGVTPVHGYEQPEGVSCSYDEAELREYQPDAYVGHLDVKPSASYAGIYSSPDRGTDVYVYFLHYERQDGVTPADSHAADREPVYVLVDNRTGAVERVVYSVYHYTKATATPSSLPMNGSHVQLYVVNPWHQYLPSVASGVLPSVASGARVPLKNYCTAVDDWHANGWRASVEATTNPWTMTHRASWWKDGTLNHVASEEYWDARRALDGVVSGSIVPNVGSDGVVPNVDSGDVVPDVTSDDLVPEVNASVPGVGA